MRFAVAALVLAGTIAIAASSVSGTVVSQAKSQWDGVYTEEQAKRGAELYSQYCASCHGADLRGGGMAPALTGGEFNANWNDLTLGELFERIRVSMPQNAAGSLSRQQVADILAHILAIGNTPTGQTELAAQADALNGIKFVAKTTVK